MPAATSAESRRATGECRRLPAGLDGLLVVGHDAQAVRGEGQRPAAAALVAELPASFSASRRCSSVRCTWPSGVSAFRRPKRRSMPQLLVLAAFRQVGQRGERLLEAGRGLAVGRARERPRSRAVQVADRLSHRSPRRRGGRARRLVVERLAYTRSMACKDPRRAGRGAGRPAGWRRPPPASARGGRCTRGRRPGRSRTRNSRACSIFRVWLSASPDEPDDGGQHLVRHRRPTTAADWSTSWAAGPGAPCARPAPPARCPAPRWTRSLVGPAVRAALALQDWRLGQGPHRLLEEERVAVRPLDQRPAASPATDRRRAARAGTAGHAVAAQGVDAELGVEGALAPAVLVLRPEGHQHEHARDAAGCRPRVEQRLASPSPPSARPRRRGAAAGARSRAASGA